jgi:hypothetical protein
VGVHLLSEAQVGVGVKTALDELGPLVREVPRRRRGDFREKGDFNKKSKILNVRQSPQDSVWFDSAKTNGCVFSTLISCFAALQTRVDVAAAAAAVVVVMGDRSKAARL